MTSATMDREAVRADGGARPDDVAAAAAVALRRFPYPYKAALAICSDLDETATARDYFEMVRFLNTTEATRFGTGVGLEVGNSIYFDMPSDQFSYWNADDGARHRIRELIQSGHVDCLHSFGDLATTRAHAERALDDLVRHGCPLKVWVDHAVAPSNFGADIMYGSGDLVQSPAFHADLTCAFGVEFVWRGRVTSVIGQDVPRKLAGIGRARHPLGSAVTVGKEAAKGVIGRLTPGKYTAHPKNEVVWESTLRSGHRVWEFMRSNPSWAGVSVYETADGLGEVMTPDVLRRLIDRQGACVLYTHLGKMRNREELAPATRDALELLGRSASDGDLLVTTTRRLLELCRGKRTVSWRASARADGIDIDVSTGGAGAGAVEGLTLYVDRPERARVVVDGVPASELRVNAPDDTGRASVSIPWRRLAFPGE